MNKFLFVLLFISVGAKSQPIWGPVDTVKAYIMVSLKGLRQSATHVFKGYVIRKAYTYNRDMKTEHDWWQYKPIGYLDYEKRPLASHLIVWDYKLLDHE